jgi:hypothetical protein
MNFTCPVCFYDKLEEPARDYNICVCCGTEFGNDDDLHTHTELRAMWIAIGAKWFFRTPPHLWNPWRQLATANVALPYHAEVSFSGLTNLTLASNLSVQSPEPETWQTRTDLVGMAA